MQLIRARITKFKSIDNSGSVTIDPDVTVLVGQNESGKTAFLQALHKAQPVENGITYSVIEEYPRKELTAYRKRHDDKPEVVGVLTYRLTSREVDDINGVLGLSLLPEHFEFTRTVMYGGKSVIGGFDFPENNYIQNILRGRNLGEETAKLARSATNITQLIERLQAEDLNTDGQELLKDLKARFGNVVGNWAGTPLSWYVWNKLVMPLVPKFLYFDDYSLLPDKTNLRALKYRVDVDSLQPEDRTVLALLTMADIDLDDLLGTEGYESSVANLEALSNTITEQIFEFWTQNKNLEVLVDVRADPQDDPPFNQGPNLYVRIRHNRHKVTVPFGQRSRGFIWFFSFLVWFDSVKERVDGSRALILLLDEPGMNLHALAQADLLRYIDTLAQEHQILYTTHSPFMVHGDRLHQVRMVEDREGRGTTITDDLTGSDPATVFPLQAALGYTLAQNLFISKRNLLVEGPADLVYLRYMSSVLDQLGRKGLSEDITIVPVGGLDKLATFVALLRGNELEMVVLHDSTGKPDQRLVSVVQQKLINDRQLLNYGMFVSANSNNAVDVEDLFTPGEYITLFNSTYAKDLHGHKIKISDLPQGDRIVERITRYLKEQKITVRPSGGYNHYSVANYLAANPVKKLDEKTLAQFESLFVAVNRALQ